MPEFVMNDPADNDRSLDALDRALLNHDRRYQFLTASSRLSLTLAQIFRR